MARSGSPCGACKFLRRKCASGCVFAPFFYHEEGLTEFAAIHRVFGASNVSKLLARLPLSERHQAALTISYEAQARLQDPIYGCVFYISALQQQVLILQAQLAFFKQEAADQQTLMNGGGHNWLQSEYPDMVMPQFGDTSNYIGGDSTWFGADNGDGHNWLQSEYPDMVMPQFGDNSNYIGGDSTWFGADNGDGHNWLQSEYPDMVMPQFGDNSNYIGGDSTWFGADNGDGHNWLQSEYLDMVMPQFGDNSNYIGGDSTWFGADNGDASIGRNGRYDGSSSSMASVIGNTNDLNLIAFGYNQT